MMTLPFDVLVIGAGQAGLASGYWLKHTGLSFALLEAGERPAGSWPQYYDSLTLFSPARYSSLPGMPFPGGPDHYPTRDEVIDYLTTYAERFPFPLITESRVMRIFREGTHFQVETALGDRYEACRIIAATRPFHQPYLPVFVGQDVFQGQILHASVYRTRAAFRDQRVIVVGAGNSAVQIVVELAQVAHVTLASRTPLNFRPQIIGDRDIHFWAWLTGLDRLPLGNWWQQFQRTYVSATLRGVGADASRVVSQLHRALKSERGHSWRPVGRTCCASPAFSR